MLKYYRTIKIEGSHEIEIKKSRFICHIQRTESEEEAEDFIKQVKEAYPDATHHCQAYLIGDEDQYQRARDDGEPSGTAGLPMLDLLKKRQLKNVTAVVVRYFGGTLLGSGGLVRAYSAAVNETIDQLGVVERRRLNQLQLQTDYSSSGKIENELRQNKHVILEDIHYGQMVTFICFLEEEYVDNFYSQAMNFTAGKAQIEKAAAAYVEIEQER